MAKHPHSVALAARFGSVGSISVPIYYILFFPLTELLGLWYMASAVSAALISRSVAFLLHKRWTFGDKSWENTSRQAIAFAMVSGILFLSNLAHLYVLTELVGLKYGYSQLVSTFINSVASYYMTRAIFTRPDA